MQSYEIINPKIIGEFNTTISNAEDKISAANKAWNNISEHITGNVPTFLFTMQNKETKELVSFQVNETRSSKKYADYSIAEIDTKLNKEQTKKFLGEISRLNKMESEFKKRIQSGGKDKKHKHKQKHSQKRYQKDDDSSTSESSSDDEDDKMLYNKLKMFNHINQPKPIVYYWYTPVIYDVQSFFVPTINAPLTPYVEINLSSAFLG